MGLPKNSYNETAWRQANPSEARRQDRQRLKAQGFTRVGWRKFGDWDGKIPAGMRGGVWNGASHPMLPDPKRLHHDVQAWEFLTQHAQSLYETRDVSTWHFRVHTPYGWAELYFRSNHRTGRTGWW